MKIYRCFAITGAALFLALPSVAQQRCGSVKAEQVCLLRTKAGATLYCRQHLRLRFAACSVDVKRTAAAASATPSIPGAKGNALFCVKVGTTVTWKSTEKDNGFVVDVGTSSPFDPPGAIIGGSDRSVSVVAKRTGCFKYSAGACRSGAIYGMCDTANAKFIVIESR